MDTDPFRHGQRSSFNAFVNAKLGYPQKLMWTYTISTATPDDDEALQLLDDLMSDYASALQTERLDELMSQVADDLATREQDSTPQAECWRAFSRALHRADKQKLQRLTLDHEEVSILWQSADPDDIVPQMDEIAESYSVPVISISGDGQQSQIMTPDFGVVRLELHNDTWKIDGEPIILARMAERERRNA